MDMTKIGRYLFLLGLVISVIAGFVYTAPDMYVVAGLLILGIIVGVLNVTGKEVQACLWGTVALVLVGSALSALAALPGGTQVASIITHFTVFVAGGALIVALKEVYGVTSSK